MVTPEEQRMAMLCMIESIKTMNTLVIKMAKIIQELAKQQTEIRAKIWLLEKKFD